MSSLCHKVSKTADFKCCIILHGRERFKIKSLEVVEEHMSVSVGGPGVAHTTSAAVCLGGLRSDGPRLLRTWRTGDPTQPPGDVPASRLTPSERSEPGPAANCCSCCRQTHWQADTDQVVRSVADVVGARWSRRRPALRVGPKHADPEPRLGDV